MESFSFLYLLKQSSLVSMLHMGASDWGGVTFYLFLFKCYTRHPKERPECLSIQRTTDSAAASIPPPESWCSKPQKEGGGAVNHIEESHPNSSGETHCQSIIIISEVETDKKNCRLTKLKRGKKKRKADCFYVAV